MGSISLIEYVGMRGRKLGFHISNGICGHKGEESWGSISQMEYVGMRGRKLGVPKLMQYVDRWGSWGFHISNVEDGGSINQMPVSIERQTSLVLAVAAPLSSDPALFTPDLDGGCENCDGCCSCCCCCL